MRDGAMADKAQIATLASRLAGGPRLCTIRRLFALDSGNRWNVPIGD